MTPSANPKKIAVIVAGGIGVRMGAALPKQFMELGGKPIIVRTVETFLSSYPDMEVVLVLPAAYLADGLGLFNNIPDRTRIHTVEGGETRFHSVQNGLKKITESSIVFVHDAVRCLLTVELIHRCHDQAIQLGSAIPAIGSKDSVRLLEDGRNRSWPRDQVRLIQTPQTFRSEVLLPAYSSPYRSAFTDDASVVESNGGVVHLIEGEERNIKITSPADLVLAANYLST